jgi:hypothetical protein
LVVYHNKFATAKGWIRTSAAYSVKTESGEHMLIQKRLGEGLGLSNDGNNYCIFHDPINGLEYIRNNKELHEKGLYIELEAYKCQVFMSFREVQDNEWHQYANLEGYLNGRGVPNIDEAMKEIFLQPIHQAFRELVNPGYFRWVISNRVSSETDRLNRPSTSENILALLNEAESKSIRLLDEVKQNTLGVGDPLLIADSIKLSLLACLYLPSFADRFPLPSSRKYQQAMKYLHAGNLKTSPWRTGDAYAWGVILGWLVTSPMGKIISDTGYEEVSRSWIDEWMLNKILVSTLDNLGLDDRSNWRAVTLIKLLTSHHAWWTMINIHPKKAEGKPAYQILTNILSDNDAQSYLGVNRYQDTLWFNKESFEDLVWWLFIIATLEISSQQTKSDQNSEVGKKILQCFNAITALVEQAGASGYRLERLLDLVR